MAGIDITTVKELLGHKTLTMTLRYAHLAPSHKVKAVDILDSAINGKSTIQKLYNQAVGESFKDAEVIENIGGCYRDRTCGPLIKSQLLYQLS